MRVLFLFANKRINALQYAGSGGACPSTTNVNRSGMYFDIGYPQFACRILLTRGEWWFKMVASGTEWGSN